MTRTYLPYLCSISMSQLRGWRGSGPSHGAAAAALLPSSWGNTIQCGAACRHKAQPRGRRGAAQHRLSCNWSRDAAALLQTLASKYLLNSLNCFLITLLVQTQGDVHWSISLISIQLVIKSIAI